MSLGTFSVGAYEMTYTPPAGAPGAGVAQNAGLVEGVRRLRRRVLGETMQADQFGKTVIEGIYQGADVFALMTFKEWTAAVRNILWPFSTSGHGDLGLPGRLMSSLAGDMVLTATAGTPAATNGFTTIRAAKAILAEENDLEYILGNEARDIPVLFRLYPYVDGSYTRHYSTT